MNFSKCESAERGNKNSNADCKKKGNRKNKKRSAKQIERARLYRERKNAEFMNSTKAKINRKNYTSIAFEQHVYAKPVVPPQPFPGTCIPVGTAVYQPAYSLCARKNNSENIQVNVCPSALVMCPKNRNNFYKRQLFIQDTGKSEYITGRPEGLGESALVRENPDIIKSEYIERPLKSFGKSELKGERQGGFGRSEYIIGSLESFSKSENIRGRLYLGSFGKSEFIEERPKGLENTENTGERLVGSCGMSEFLREKPGIFANSKFIGKSPRWFKKAEFIERSPGSFENSEYIQPRPVSHGKSERIGERLESFEYIEGRHGCFEKSEFIEEYPWSSGESEYVGESPESFGTEGGIGKFEMPKYIEEKPWSSGESEYIEESTERFGQSGCNEGELEGYEISKYTEDRPWSSGEFEFDEESPESFEKSGYIEGGQEQFSQDLVTLLGPIIEELQPGIVSNKLTDFESAENQSLKLPTNAKVDDAGHLITEANSEHASIQSSCEEKKIIERNMVDSIQQIPQKGADVRKEMEQENNDLLNDFFTYYDNIDKRITRDGSNYFENLLDEEAIFQLDSIDTDSDRSIQDDNNPFSDDEIDDEDTAGIWSLYINSTLHALNKTANLEIKAMEDFGYSYFFMSNLLK